MFVTCSRQAKKAAPCIIFIDEIDARPPAWRWSGGGHDEREQTLNQMLVEMDGFEGNGGIIVIAATNRPDVSTWPCCVLAVRPSGCGGLPDVRGREQILKFTCVANHRPLISTRNHCPWYSRFSAADLANLVNQAAPFAARGNKRVVSMVEFEQAKDKIIMGAERRSW